MSTQGWVVGKRIVLGLVCLLGVVAVTGCGGLGKLHPVEGKITVDGSNLTTGMVTFTPEKPFKQPVEIRGEVSNGSYTMTTNGKPGVPEGRYKVAVAAVALPKGHDPSSMKPGDPVAPPPSGPQRLVNEKYEMAATSGLEVTVPGGNYELKVSR